MVKSQGRYKGRVVCDTTHLRGVLFSGILILAPLVSRAGTLSVQFSPPNGETCLISGSSSHENATCGNGAFVASGSASYGNLAASIDTIMRGQAEVTTYFLESVDFSGLGVA